jgi:hypothetical protein
MRLEQQWEIGKSLCLMRFCGVVYDLISVAMNTLKLFFTSPLFGFLLKLLSGLAAAGFGLFGIGTKTRDDKGKLTRDGRIALIGVLVAGVIAGTSSIYEFSVGQEKDRQEHLQSQRLMLSVQRGLYPLRGVSGDLRLTFTQDFAGLTPYKEILRQQLPPPHQKCKPTQDFSCFDEDEGGNVYGIPEKSRLFPKQESLVGTILNGLGLGFRLVKLGPGNGDPNYNLIASFDFVLRDGIPKDRMLTFSPGSGKFGYVIGHFDIPDERTTRATVYSLVEVFPGFISASMDVDRSFDCDATKKLGVPDCFDTIHKPISDGLKINKLRLRFPYPKAINFDDQDIRCKFFDEGEGLLVMLPDDIEHVDELGNFDVRVDSGPYEKSICAAFMNPAF